MNKVLKNVLIYVVEVLLATILWCVLDYFLGETLNILANLRDVALVVLIINVSKYVIEKFTKKK